MSATQRWLARIEAMMFRANASVKRDVDLGLRRTTRRSGLKGRLEWLWIMRAERALHSAVA
jgi:hypothetical protein